MADKKYTIIESVGSGHQTINDYEDIEKHHPTWKEDPKKRFYGEIDGKREEFVYSPDGRQMLSKDIILKVDGSSHVAVPSPVEGYVKRTDRWGMVEIYEQPDGKGQMIARVRHMEPVQIADGAHVVYGQPLGIQGGKNPNGKPFGTHTHIDIDVGYLDKFKQYIRDIDTGAIAVGKYPAKAVDMHYNGSQLEPVSPQSSVAPISTPVSNSDYKTEVLTKTTAAVNDLCDARGYPNHGGRDNMSCHLANDLITQGSQGTGKFQAALGVDGKTISVREQISEFKDFIASADSNVIVNIPKADSLAKIAAYEAPVLAQNSPTHEQEISRGRSL